MHRYLLIAALLCFVAGVVSVHAQGLYKWVDSRGGVHYTNTPTNGTAKTVDDTLPPASNFKSLAPPEPPPATEAAKSDSQAPADTPTGDSSEQPQAANPE